MKFIDSHCHLPSLSHKTDLDKLIADARDNEVTDLINIGTSLKENQQAINVAGEYQNIYATAAIYPNSHRGENVVELIGELENQVGSSKKVVAIGECGIDFSQWQNARPLEEQLELFKRQVELSLKLNLPLVIHNRNADETILGILREFSGPTLRGVIHCFSSTWETAQKFMKLGFYISFSGFITRKSKAFLVETIEKVPQDRYILETDSPYILPSPKYVKIVAQKVAEVRQIDIEDVAQQTHTNTCRLFDLQL